MHGSHERPLRLRLGHAFRRHTVACALAALLALPVAVILAPAALAAPAAAVANGQITGHLVDGTTGGKAIAGQTVALMVHDGAADRQVATSVTDGQGLFHFTGLATDQAELYYATVHYQGATYTTDPISLAGDPHPSPVTLLAYESTTSSARIGVAQVTVLFHDPNVPRGTIQVSEAVTMVNADQKTFVGTPGPSNGMPTGLLRFALPSGAQDLTVQDGFENAQVIQVNSGFATSAPLQPGETRFAFTYDYPYGSTRAAFTYEAVYPTAQVVAIIPADMSVTAPAFKSLGQLTAVGSHVQAWQGGDLLAGQSASVVLSNLPTPGQKSDFDPAWLDALGALLALLAFGLVGYYLWRGPGAGLVLAGRKATSVHRESNSRDNQRPTTREARAARPTRTGISREFNSQAGAEDDKKSAQTAEDEESPPEALLAALAKLDAEHEAGKVGDMAYRIQRDALKSELKTRMLAQASAASARVHVTRESNSRQATGAGEQR
jgi:hypothetical protein